MEKELFGLAGIVLGFVLNSAYGAWGKRSQKHQQRYYLAVMVTLRIDKFFDEAVQVCDDGGRPDERGEYYPTTSTPKLDLQQLDVDWRCLPPDLMKDILWLPEKQREVESLISSIAEHVCNPPNHNEYFETRRYEFAKLALEANRLSADLRRIAKLPQRVLGDEYYKPEQNLQSLIKKIDQIQNERRVQQNKTNEMICKRLPTLGQS